MSAAVNLRGPAPVTAEKFAVEVQWVDGHTQVLPGTFARIELAEVKVGRVEKTIARGDTPGWRRAYVVTADGTEV